MVTAPKARQAPDWADRLNLDPKGKFSAPTVPYLREPPVNGCKVMAGGATSAMGESGVAGGLVCAKRF
ncbi:hypothetical protein [Phenylobacterium sp. J367]|uniref:hypothetical protein n=1 Tax=Phenylobacterium sp. J367 TaxID=2898435 RepID=UPI0021508AEB|nr:hypothetical protein [Phenylobacterium sp. J367]MCR5877487.1 hypothetical protein [Phenylobacterium sp. J367]